MRAAASRTHSLPVNLCAKSLANCPKAIGCFFATRTATSLARQWAVPDHHNRERPQEPLKNVTPDDVYCVCRETILLR